MIRSFVHKGLQAFYRTGDRKGIKQAHVSKIRLILTHLDQATAPNEMNIPGLYLHPLKGKRSGIWSVRVSGNWRITFRFVGKDVEIVNYEDYH